MPTQGTKKRSPKSAPPKGSQEFTVLDVEKLDLSNPDAAVSTFLLAGRPKIVRCQIFIAGGGMGGIAAAVRAAQLGCRVCLTEETSWIGGQMTTQGVSALDENRFVETSGATRLYQQLRTAIRLHYRQQPGISQAAAKNDLLNPGNCWVSYLSFEPEVALNELKCLMEKHTDSRLLSMQTRQKVVKLKIKNGRVQSALAVDLDSGKFIEYRAKYFLDATELGDLLPLAKIDYRSGAESSHETGEPHAPEVANHENVQDFTYPFVVDLADDDRHSDQLRIDKPATYDDFRNAGKFSLCGYKMFAAKEASAGTSEHQPFWTYRRLLARENFPNSKQNQDLSMINWDSNDLRGHNIIDQPPAAQAQCLALAKQLSLSFLYWLKTEAPRDDCGADGERGRGYPQLRLRKDVLGSQDGLSKFPYIRESRRIKALKMIVEQDIAAAYNEGARAAVFADSVGIGFYPIDIHGHQDVPGAAQASRPFQIPLSAMIQTAVRNLIPACKNIGTTHVTNGAYRLHSIEWAVGEAAGTLAAFCMRKQTTPKAVLTSPLKLRLLQQELVSKGAPIYWFDDVPTSHANFQAIQLLAVTGIMPGAADTLNFKPDSVVSATEFKEVLGQPALKSRQVQLAMPGAAGDATVTRGQLAQAIYEQAVRQGS